MKWNAISSHIQTKNIVIKIDECECFFFFCTFLLLRGNRTGRKKQEKNEIKQETDKIVIETKNKMTKS